MCVRFVAFVGFGVNKHDIIIILIIICHHTLNALRNYSASLWISAARCTLSRQISALVTDGLVSYWQIMHSWGSKRPSIAIYVTKLKLVEPGVSECSMMISLSLYMYTFIQLMCDGKLYGEHYNDIVLNISL
jgi:hypothetical protein